MKKIAALLSIFTLLSVFCYQTVFADRATVTTSVNHSTGEVTISGKATDKGQTVTLIVINTLNSLEYVGETITGEDGNFAFVFTLFERKYKVYKVALGGDVSLSTEFTLSEKEDKDKDHSDSGR